jgi:hypothetical protein
MKKISFEAFDQWVENIDGVIAEEAFFNESEHFEDEGVQFHEGDLHVATLETAPCVVVNGNLTVDGTIQSSFDCGLLVVNGDLRCDHFTYSFNAVISGSLFAETIDVNSLNDFGLVVGGNIVANSVIERGHFIRVIGRIESPVVKSMMNQVTANGVTYPRVPYEET